jgi:hypothetical protein
VKLTALLLAFLPAIALVAPAAYAGPLDGLRTVEVFAVAPPVSALHAPPKPSAFLASRDGLELTVARDVFLAGTYRHVFISHATGNPESRGAPFSGMFDRDRLGDADVLLAGAGFRF